MGIVTIIAIGAIIAFFWIMWPSIKKSITGQFDKITECGPGEEYVDGSCRTVSR